ncbi:MAG: hypothetical protein NTY74_14185 [Ignavibacteriae bacterium]|nr:hypothetical protein [Ignavibacteriota bacterium]
MGKKIKLLYIGNIGSQKKAFYKLLSERYYVDFFNYVLPDKIKEDFGDLKFADMIDFSRNFSGNVARNVNFSDRIIYDYGIDPCYDESDNKDFILRQCLINYLVNLGYDFVKDKSISKILQSKRKSKIFIKEDELINYELIVIENLATYINYKNYILNYSIPKRKSYDLYDDPKHVTSHVEYKISPNILSDLLRSNKKLLFLMDYSTDIVNWDDKLLYRYNEVLERLHISQFALYNGLTKEDNKDEGELFHGLLTGIDIKSSLGNIPKMFIIKINSEYKSQIKNYSFLFKDVNTLYLNHPLQLIPINKDGIKDNHKTLLAGNKKTTKLFVNWEDKYYTDVKKIADSAFNHVEDIGIEDIDYCLDRNGNRFKIKSWTEFHSKKNFKFKLKESYYERVSNPEKYREDILMSHLEKYLLTDLAPVFGVLDTDKRNMYSILSGNICSDDYLNDPLCDNKRFVGNVIDCLLKQVDSDNKTIIDPRPKININLENGKLYIGEIHVKLDATLFCYYRYFAERAMNNLGFEDIREALGSEYYKNVEGSDYDNKPIISSQIIPKIIKYHKDSFHDDGNRKRLEDKLARKQTSKITTFASYQSRIKKALQETLNNILDDKLIESLTIINNPDRKYSYGIKYPSDKIIIQ